MVRLNLKILRRSSLILDWYTEKGPSACVFDHSDFILALSAYKQILYNGGNKLLEHSQSRKSACARRGAFKANKRTYDSYTLYTNHDAPTVQNNGKDKKTKPKTGLEPVTYHMC